MRLAFVLSLAVTIAITVTAQTRPRGRERVWGLGGWEVLRAIHPVTCFLRSLLRTLAPQSLKARRR